MTQELALVTFAALDWLWVIVFILVMIACGVIPKLPEYQQFWLLAALVGVVYLPVTLLTKPDDMEHLVQYYVMARPLGWWGPVRREALQRGLITAGEAANRGVRNGAIAQKLEPGSGR